ncbi:MAG: hypothetical protein HOV79_25870 [Hamadaea sp.]|nr:hypothetical protein [Hamadaea sp.]
MAQPQLPPVSAEVGDLADEGAAPRDPAVLAWAGAAAVLPALVLGVLLGDGLRHWMPETGRLVLPILGEAAVRLAMVAVAVAPAAVAVTSGVRALRAGRRSAVLAVVVGLAGLLFWLGAFGAALFF